MLYNPTLLWNTALAICLYLDRNLVLVAIAAVVVATAAVVVVALVCCRKQVS